MKFKSNAKFGKEHESGGIFELKDNSLRICIHKYAGCGDALFLNCRALNIDNYDLFTENFNEAVCRSKQIISETMEIFKEEAAKFCNDDSVEIVRY